MNFLNRFVILGILVGALVLRGTFFWISVSSLPASVDEASAVLQAKRILNHVELPILFPGQPYLFPFESYLLAPLVNKMPRNALGARYIGFLLGLMTLFTLLILFYRLGSTKKVWPGVLLCLFPSSYWLILQAAYALPGYGSLCLFSCASLLLGWMSVTKRSLFLTALAGLVGGLAFSSHMLSLCVVMPVGIWICLGWDGRSALKRTAIYALGSLIGLIPYGLALMIDPGAYQSIVGTRSWHEGFSLWFPMMESTLPGVMGWTLPIFPDIGRSLNSFPNILIKILIVVYLLILVWVSILRMILFFKRFVRFQWPVLEINDVFVAASWLCQILFILDKRSHHSCCRYLLPLVICFPFMLNYLYVTYSRTLKYVIGAFACFFLILNFSASAQIMSHWSQPDFAKTDVALLDLKPIVHFLDTHHIRYCYAGFWLADRIVYETDERIICSEPFNRRFLGWPLPYKDSVDQAKNVAYILAFSGSMRFETIQDFEQDLSKMGVSCEKEICGDFEIYFNFKHEISSHDQLIPKEDMTLSFSLNTTSLKKLNDGDHTSFWKSDVHQQKGIWIQTKLQKKRALSRISLFYNRRRFFWPKSINIFAHTQKGWEEIRSHISSNLDPFDFKNGHPVYGDHIQTIRFSSVDADGLRIEIDSPVRGPWSMSEIEVYSDNS